MTKQIGCYKSDWYIMGIDGKYNNACISHTESQLRYTVPRSPEWTINGLGFAYLREHGFEDYPELYGIVFYDMEWRRRKRYPGDFYVEIPIFDSCADTFHLKWRCKEFRVHQWSNLRKETKWVKGRSSYTVCELAHKLPHEEFIEYLKDNGIYIVNEGGVELG